MKKINIYSLIFSGGLCYFSVCATNEQLQLLDDTITRRTNQTTWVREFIDRGNTLVTCIPNPENADISAEKFLELGNLYDMFVCREFSFIPYKETEPTQDILAAEKLSHAFWLFARKKAETEKNEGVLRSYHRILGILREEEGTTEEDLLSDYTEISSRSSSAASSGRSSPESDGGT